MTAQPGKNLFDNTDGDLNQIVQVIDRLKSLNAALSAHLPAAMAAHCQVANLTKGKLIVTLDSNAWASRFYYEKPALLAALRQTPDFAGIAQIEHRVNPDLFQHEKINPHKPKPTPQLSEDAKAGLDTLIQSAEGDLKAKLMQLRSRFN